MNKPISVAIAELKEKLDRDISESGLPPVIIEPIVGTYHAALSKMALEETIKERQEWEKTEDKGE